MRTVKPCSYCAAMTFGIIRLLQWRKLKTEMNAQHPTLNSQHPTPNTQRPTSNAHAQRPTPNTQRPTPNAQHPTPNTQRPTPTHPHTLLIGKGRGFHPPLQNPAPFLKPETFSFSAQTSNSRQMACGWPEAGGRRARSVRSGAWGEKVIVSVDPQAGADPPSASDRSADCA
jgi:hypothetical protein